jgi:hypothetical protein
MLRFISALFVVLHGLVHLLYLGQSRRLFELQPGLAWPDGSWAFSRLFGEAGTRGVASVSCMLAALGFVVGGVALLGRQAWWRPVVAGAAAFSGLIFFLLWNGRLQHLDDNGAFALLINGALLIALLVLRWPAL